MFCMKRSRITACAAVALAVMTLLPAAGADAATTSSTTGTSTVSTTTKSATKKTKDEKQPSQTIKYAKVTAVGKTEIKAELGEISLPEKGTDGMPFGAKGPSEGFKTPPRMPSGDGKFPGMPADGKLPEFSSDKKDKKDGDSKASDNKMPDISSMITWSGTKTQIDISGVKITNNGKDASVSDISKGDILTLIYKDDTLTEIKIGAELDMGGSRGEKPAKSPKTKKSSQSKTSSTKKQ